jgi:hypothetical protein
VLASLALAACPWRGDFGSYSNCSFWPNNLWVSGGFEHFLSQPSSCPIEVSPNGTLVRYAASVQVPRSTVTGFSSSLSTHVYNNQGIQITYSINDWYLVDYDTYEADIAFKYVAGTGKTFASFFADDAINTAFTAWGWAEADVSLDYRVGASASLQGSASPTPGTSPTWTVNISNAAPPYTYRWFKDGVELVDQTSASIQLPVTTSYFTLKVIGQSSSDGADTLVAHIEPSWNVAIYGMSERSPNLVGCPFASDTGNNPSGPFSYRWTLDGIDLQENGPTVDPALSMGSHTLDLTVTDANGYMASAAMTINMTQGGPANCT